jgi:hypothetical protein
MRSALYTGTLIHARRQPAENVFRYGVCFYVLDLDELPALARRLKLFSLNRPNVVAFHDRDHLGDPSRSVKDNVVAHLADAGIDVDGGRILLLTNLRVLGYVFNPVSFFWCFRESGELACVVAEVSNTFGEMLPYVLPAEEGRVASAPSVGRARQTVEWRTPKQLHVSPFFQLDQEYRFFLSEPGERIHARVDVWQDGERRLGSVLAGERRPLTNATLAKALARYPLMPQQVTGLIHWQALKLWRKRVPFHHKPPFVPGVGSVKRP